MQPFILFARAFGIPATVINLEEDLKSAAAKLAANRITVPREADIISAVAQFSNRDTVVCRIKIDDTDALSFQSRNRDAIGEFLKNLQDNLSVVDSTYQAELEITVEKRIINGELTLFSLDAFRQHLSGASLRNNLMKFSDIFADRKILRFVCVEPIEAFNSENLWFGNADNFPLIPSSGRNRESLLLKRNDVCHFENASDIRCLPEDFFLQNRSKYAALNEVFDKLSIAASVIFIADIAQFEDDNSLFYKINGYKAVTGKISSLAAPPKIADTFFKIYQWIYEGGVIDDKIGLARNLLTLHAKNGNILQLDADILTSIRSGYQIYLKQNVEQYIEIKNKLVEYLSELSQKAAKLGENLGDSLSQNFLGFVTFFVTVIVINALADKDFTGSFSPNLALIAYGLIAASFLHWILSLCLLNRETRLLQKGYRAVQERYADLLDKNDLNNAFNHDAEFNVIAEHIRFKRNWYAVLWIAYLIIFSLVVAKLTPNAAKEAKLTNVPMIVKNLPTNATFKTNLTVPTVPIRKTK